MDFYTTVFRKSGSYWISLCLENGLVGQGATKDEAMRHLQEAITAFEEAVDQDKDVYSAPISIKELHEFLTVEEETPASEIYELRTVYA
jgi:predicted RNase H-like HicB family nuclease